MEFCTQSQSLSLGDNQLSGSFPKCLDELEFLDQLLFFRNQFSVHSLTFANRFGLRSLDLEKNKFSGPILINLIDRIDAESFNLLSLAFCQHSFISCWD